MAVTKSTTTPRFKRTGRSTRVATERAKRAAGEGEVSPAPEAGRCSGAVVVRRPLRPPSDPGAILPVDFFLADALDLAPRLLGKLLRRDDVILRITEFGIGGHAYVYMCYGIHMMLNIVADRAGVGAAVLIRSCSPISGLETIQQRRGQKTDKPVLLAGPGKVGQALGLSTEWSNHPLYTSGGLELLDGPIPERILVGPRVGIEYASPEHVAAPWRFAIADCPWISAPKNTLGPP